MQIEYEGKSYDFDMEDMDILQANAIQDATGMTIKQWQDELKELNPRALQAMWWLILVQNGHNPKSDLRTVNVKPLKLGLAFYEAMKRDNPDAFKDEEENPTKPRRSPRASRK